MWRIILAIVSSTISYPYAWCFFLFLSGGHLGGGHLGGEMAIARSEGIRDLLDFLEWGTLGLMFFGIPILVIAGLFALVIHALQARSAWIVTACATLTSLFTTMLTAVATGSLSKHKLLTWTHADTAGLIGVICAGAVSGWIYWRIGIRGLSNGPDPRSHFEAQP